MKRKLFLSLICAVSIAFVSNGQTMREEIAANPNLAGGIYTAYMVTEQPAVKAPSGYKPFYISHYGRHGSRYQTAQEKYDQPVELLEQAYKDGCLTELGKDLMRRVKIIAEDAHMRAGDLSLRGEREHKGIAERMATLYPQVFSGKNGNHVTCFSSPSVRSVISMAAFTERLKEIYPKLELTRYASAHDIDMTRPESNMNIFYKKARKMAKDYQRDNTQDKEFICRIFNDYDHAAELIRKVYNSPTTHLFMGNMHDLAMIVQNFDNLPELHDIFTEPERYQMWHLFNIRRYLTYGPSIDFGDIRNQDGKLLLRDIIERADKVISGETANEVATLRFGHDSAVIPLLAILHVEGCDGRISFAEIERLPEVWCDSRITSMSVNVQFIFYRNKKGDVLVRMLHSERDVRLPVKTDCYPFYKWEDFRAYCVAQCEPDAK
ncbi:MAG: histidine-type phosphatase [Alistipes sp.]|nr:histidine-type phosphatase [Alistipes sp.]